MFIKSSFWGDVPEVNAILGLDGVGDAVRVRVRRGRPAKTGEGVARGVLENAIRQLHVVVCVCVELVRRLPRHGHDVVHDADRSVVRCRFVEVDLLVVRARVVHVVESDESRRGGEG